MKPMQLLCQITTLVLCGFLTGTTHGADALTIYSTATPGAVPPDMYRPVPGGGRYTGQSIPGYAVVRHERPVLLRSGRSTLRFTDVAAFIDPTTVHFVSLTDPARTRVIEQSFQFDLVNSQKLIQKFIDQPVTIDQIMGDSVQTLTGKLLSADGGLILQDKSGQIHSVRHFANIRFPELPGGLITRPTLEWDIQARRAGEHQTRVSYQTTGLTWWTDYNLVYSDGANANSGWLDVGAWVSIINQSGASYNDARLKLIAGDVHRAQLPAAVSGAMKRHAARELAQDSVAGFEEKSFFEFHLYTLGRPTTLPNQSTKQIELFPTANRVPAQKVLVYYGLAPQYYGFFPSPVTDRNYGTQSNKKVDVYLKFKNDKNYRLGVPLPSGRIRVSKIDNADGTLEFIGEDVIDHTPKDEDVLIKLGSAFDVVGERTQVDFRIDTAGKWMEEEVEVTLRNHKDEAVEVMVKENLYRWVTWKIVEHNRPFTKKDARTIHFPVKIAADGEVKVRYRVRYTW